MCIPQPKDPVIPPTNVPSMESASGLDLAGVPRGAAGLARLKLRTGEAAAASPAAKVTAPIAPSASSIAGVPARDGGDGSTPWARANVPNKGLSLAIP
jgi:hypothetical protein